MKKLMLFLLTLLLTLTGLGINDSISINADSLAAELPGGVNYLSEANFTVTQWEMTSDDPIRIKPNTKYGFNILDDLGYALGVDMHFAYSYDGTNWIDIDCPSYGGHNYAEFTTDATHEFIHIKYYEANQKSSSNMLNNITTNGWEYYDIQLVETPYTAKNLYQTYYPYVAPLDETAPLINGATAVHLVNVDSPTSVSAFKSTLTATDNVDGDITSNITVVSDDYTGNENSLGDRNVQFSVSDSSGNTTTVTVVFKTVDVSDPIITLNGALNIDLEYGTSWSEPGSSVTDNYDTGLTVLIDGAVNDNVLGTYELLYTAVDNSGNEASTKLRIVNVVDTTAPVQSLSGDSVVYIEFGNNYNELGATWTDAYDGSGSSIITGSVNVAVPGTYTIRYNITDSNGNIANEITRTVIVQDTTAPTFIGETNYLYNTGSSLLLNVILEGITANDLFDGDLTSNITVTSDNYTGHETEKGTFTVVLSVTDSNGNIETMTLNIEVIDNEAPVFSTSSNLYTVAYANTLTQEQMKQILGVS